VGLEPHQRKLPTRRIVQTKNMLSLIDVIHFPGVIFKKFLKHLSLLKPTGFLTWIVPIKSLLMLSACAAPLPPKDWDGPFEYPVVYNTLTQCLSVIAATGDDAMKLAVAPSTNGASASFKVRMSKETIASARRALFSLEYFQTIMTASELGRRHGEIKFSSVNSKTVADLIVRAYDVFKQRGIPFPMKDEFEKPIFPPP